MTVNCLPWDRLSYATQYKLWSQKSDRVPKDWVPEGGRATYVVTNRFKVTNPLAVVVDIPSVNVDLTEPQLWQLLADGWASAGISPINVHFRVKSQVIAVLPNPHFVPRNP